MIRTQIYLPKQLYENIKLRAKMADKPAAQVIREYIDKGMETQQRPAQKDGLMKLASLNITGGPNDLASNLDDYLYGDKK
jgi:hypothetical protein